MWTFKSTDGQQPISLLGFTHLFLRNHVESTGVSWRVIIQRKESGWMYHIYSCACIDSGQSRKTRTELGFSGLKVEHFEYVTWTKLQQSTVANHNVGWHVNINHLRTSTPDIPVILSDNDCPITSKTLLVFRFHLPILSFGLDPQGYLDD